MVILPSFTGLNKPQGAAGSSLLTNLVSYWKLDESAGASAVDAVGSNTLAVTGTVGSTTGKISNARTFGGTNNYLSIADNSSLSITGNITISAWVYVNNTNDMYFVSKYNTGSNQRSYTLCREGSVVKFVVSANGTALITAQTPGNITSSAWHHILGWYDGTNVNVQVDGGTVYSTAHSTGIYDSSASFSISGLFAPSHFGGLNGNIDEVGIWNKALNSTERGLLYNAGAGLTHPF